MKALVSIGIVDEQLEVMLYCRVAKPLGSRVVDDSFVRTIGGLGGDWSRGMPYFQVRDCVRDLVNSGASLVGWAIHNDLEGLGLAAEVPKQQQIELQQMKTDHVS